MPAQSLNPIALTMGDPVGIGPEIAIKAWQDLRRNPDNIPFAILAPLPLLTRTASEVGAPPPIKIDDIAETKAIFSKGLPVLDNGYEIVSSERPDSDNAAAITASIRNAVTLTLSGDAGAVVTNPISKDVLYEAGFPFPGHTEFLADLTKDMVVIGEHGPVMMLVGGGLRVGLVTIHLPLKEAAKQLCKASIVNKARVMHRALQCDFGIKAPRIALTGLNPHAGENGTIGREEIDIINPAARELRKHGITVTDAQPADTLFHAEAREHYDAVLAMYHDQGLIPVKTLDFHGGVNVTLGLPIIRTSPDHGTAFNIAGKGIARADSLIAAIKTASELNLNRMAYDAG